MRDALACSDVLILQWLRADVYFAETSVAAANVSSPDIAVAISSRWLPAARRAERLLQRQSPRPDDLGRSITVAPIAHDRTAVLLIPAIAMHDRPGRAR